MDEKQIDRRTFALSGVTASVLIGGQAEALPQEKAKRIRVAVIGCGSVSGVYLPHLSKCPHVELVSACDIIPERAKDRAEKFKIPNQYPHIDKLLAGAPFDMMVNLTDMQEHEHLNVQAVEAGKHVWSEKPMANSLKAGQDLLAAANKKGVKIWARRRWWSAQSSRSWPRH